MTAREFLRRARDLDRRIAERQAERDALIERATGVRFSRLTGMPRGGRGDWTDAEARAIDLTRELDAQIAELCRLKEEINAVIEAVASDRHRRVLELRYRNYMGWGDIAEYLGYDPRHVHRLHAEALGMVDTILSEGGGDRASD